MSAFKAYQLSIRNCDMLVALGLSFALMASTAEPSPTRLLRLLIIDAVLAISGPLHLEQLLPPHAMPFCLKLWESGSRIIMVLGSDTLLYGLQLSPDRASGAASMANLALT